MGHAQPAARPDIRRNEEMCGIRAHVQLLRAGHCIEPQGDAPVAVVIDGIGRKGLAANPEIRGAVGHVFLSLRKPEAYLPHCLVSITYHNSLRAGYPWPMLQCQA